MSFLQSTLDRLRRTLRRLLLWRGICLAGATLAGGILAAAALDAAVHIESSVARMAGLLATLAAAAAVLFVAGVRPLRGAWDDVSMALLLERMFPALRDRLASAAQFAGAAESAAAQPLATLTVQESERQLVPIPMGGIVNRRPMFAAAGALAAVLIAAAGWLAFAPQQAVLALERQFTPFSAPDWPRDTLLRLLDQELHPLAGDGVRAIAGEQLTLYISNLRGDVPEDLRVERRNAEGEAEPLSVTQTSLRTRGGQESRLGVVSLTPDEGAVFVRARGGDDDSMPWHELEIVPAPRIERFRIEVMPPAYSGLPPHREERSIGHVEGLVGSRVRLELEPNVPLQRAQLRRENAPSVEVVVSSDGRSAAAEFFLTEEGRAAYWFELTDASGVSPSRPVRYEIRGRRDHAPTVEARLPPADYAATPTAVLPLQAECRDDLGLGQTLLLASVGEESLPPQTLLAPAASPEEAPQSFLVEHAWDLSRDNLQPGDVIRAVVFAQDLRQPEPQAGRSSEFVVRIITAEEKRTEIAGYQSGLATLLERLETRQAAADQRMREAAIQWRHTRTLRDEDLQTLADLDVERRRLAGDLADPRIGLGAQTERIANELAWNGIEDAAITQRLERLQRQGAELVDAILPALGDALKRAGAASQNDEDERAQAVLEAQQQQAQALATLQAMTADLREWRRRHDATQQMEELLAAQHELHERTGQIGEKTLTRALSALSPQEQSDLQQAADRQRRMQDQIDRIAAPTDEPGSQPSDENPAAGSELPPSEAQRLRGLIRQAADDIAANRIGQALAGQRSILESLQSTLEAAELTPTDAAALLEEIRKGRERIETLRKRQDAAAARLQELRPLSEDAASQEALEVLRKEQQELARETEALSTALRRRSLTRAANPTTRAAARMKDADRLLEPGEAEQAAVAQQEALDDLLQAERELAAAENEASQQALLDLLAGLSSTLSELQAGQESLREQTAAQEEALAARGRRTREDLRRLQKLSAEQQELAESVAALAERLTEADVLKLVLQRTEAAMREASERLSRRLTDAQTQAAQEEAANQLASLVEISEPPEGSEPDSPPANMADATLAEQGARALELRLVRVLQAELLERTRELQAEAASDPESADLAEKRAAIAREQAELSRQAARLLAPPEEAARPEAPQTGPPRTSLP